MYTLLALYIDVAQLLAVSRGQRGLRKYAASSVYVKFNCNVQIEIYWPSIYGRKNKSCTYAASQRTTWAAKWLGNSLMAIGRAATL